MLGSFPSERQPLWIKICGFTNAADAYAAVELGVDAVGLIFAPSPRRVSPPQAADIVRQLPSHINRVGVFVDASPEEILRTAQHVGLDTVQLHGNESLEVVRQLNITGLNVIKAVRMRNQESLPDLAALEEAGVNWFLLDAWQPGVAGGTGQTCDWSLAAQVARQVKVILAGGLHASNVAAAIQQVQPWGIDASSGVEVSPGRKDTHKVAEFVRQARLEKTARSIY